MIREQLREEAAKVEEEISGIKPAGDTYALPSVDTTFGKVEPESKIIIPSSLDVVIAEGEKGEGEDKKTGWNIYALDVLHGMELVRRLENAGIPSQYPLYSPIMAGSSHVIGLFVHNDMVYVDKIGIDHIVRFDVNCEASGEICELIASDYRLP